MITRTLPLNAEDFDQVKYILGFIRGWSAQGHECSLSPQYALLLVDFVDGFVDRTEEQNQTIKQLTNKCNILHDALTKNGYFQEKSWWRSFWNWIRRRS